MWHLSFEKIKTIADEGSYRKAKSFCSATGKILFEDMNIFACAISIPCSQTQPCLSRLLPYSPSRSGANTGWHNYEYECEYKYTHLTEYSNINVNNLGSIHECIHEYRRLTFSCPFKIFILKGFQTFTSINKNKWKLFNVSPFSCWGPCVVHPS